MGARDHDDAPVLRVPPHSAEAEQSLLGSLMLDPRPFDAAAGIVGEADFFRHEHRVIWRAIAGLVAACKSVDPVSVLERLQASGDLQHTGGLKYLNDLAQSVPGAAGVRRYAEIVRERAVLRAVVALADEAATQAFRLDGPSEVIDTLSTKLLQLERRQTRQEPVALADLVTKAMDRISDVAAGNVPPAWPTKIPTLDRLLQDGLRPGKLIVLGARPAVGKSSFALQLGLTMADQGLPVLALSQEMPASEVTERALSHLGGVDYGRLQRGKLHDAEWGGVTDAVERARTLPLWVDDQAALRLSDMRAKARHVRGLKVLIVDYLQLSQGSGKAENRNADIGEISRGLKALAKELDVCVILLSQLSRKVEDRSDKRPIVSDLRDSGEIEQDADAIVFLWPGRVLETGAKLIGCEVAKQRGGPTGDFVLQFEGAVQRWVESTETLRGPSYGQAKETRL
jgi:replicative DNA helicase